MSTLHWNKVEGMSCNHCVNSIETSVGELTGVSAVKVDLGNNEVAVDFDNHPHFAFHYLDIQLLERRHL